MKTLRQHLAAIAFNTLEDATVEHATAAMKLLDEAVQVALVGKGSVSTTEDWRLIFDPDHAEDAP